MCKFSHLVIWFISSQDPNFDEYRQQIGTASDLKKLIGIVETIGLEN